MKEIGFACIGVGQAGVNLATQFAEYFPTVVVDTASQNLNNASQIIKQDHRFHAKINEFGGAGKNIELGEQAIIKYEEEITELIENNLTESDYVWITAGLGGGTGSLGCIQVSRILNKLGIAHGMFVTLPATHEGTDEFVNASTALYSIEKARREFNNLRSIIIIENNKLKSEIMDQSTVSFENMWKEANQHIFKAFYNLFKYSQKQSDFTFDGQDYMRMLEKSGYMTFGTKVIEDVENKSQNVLVNEVKSTWEDEVFIDDLDFSKARGLAVIVNRPESYDQDGQSINKLLTEMKSFIGEGTFCAGIYKDKDSLTDKFLSKDKPLELVTAVSGLPFPKKRFEKLKETAEGGIDNYNQKEEEEDIDLDLGKVGSYVGEYAANKEEKEFSIFNHDQKSDQEEEGEKVSKMTDFSEKFKGKN
ncbi:MAG: hypothetical protein R6V17_06350 [Halanaerobacter sp.]